MVTGSGASLQITSVKVTGHSKVKKKEFSMVCPGMINSTFMEFLNTQMGEFIVENSKNFLIQITKIYLVKDMDT